MAGKKTGAKLRELAARAGRWLGRAGTPAPAPAASETAAVIADRFDAMSWLETFGEAGALQELAGELAERHDHAADLVRDVWTAAYKHEPELRPRGQMHAGRLVNHKVAATLLKSEDFTELRRHTVGDAYASAMAVLASADAIRQILEETREEQGAGDDAAGQAEQAQEAGDGVAAAMKEAEEAADGDGNVPDGQAQAVADAIDAAEQAEAAAQEARAAAAQAADDAEAKIRGPLHRGVRDAADDRAEEEDLMASWGIGPGQLERLAFDERRALAARFRTTPMVRFARLMGRFRRMAEGERARKVEGVAGELVGLTLGDDISRALPSDLASLAVPALRAEWLARWADAQLLQYETRGEERTGLGAIIACIDVSASMRTVQPDGASGDAWAKGCALALLEQARAEKRAFVGIVFASSDQVQVFRFPAGQATPPGDLADFVQFSFAGGTDFEAPLSEAVAILAAEYDADGKAKGDIVMVSDGECDVTEEWMAAWLEAKARLGFRLFGIAVERAVTPVLDALCDNARSIDDLTTPEGARDLFGLV